jgi:hypothetical protein
MRTSRRDRARCCCISARETQRSPPDRRRSRSSRVPIRTPGSPRMGLQPNRASGRSIRRIQGEAGSRHSPGKATPTRLGVRTLPMPCTRDPPSTTPSRRRTAPRRLRRSEPDTSKPRPRPHPRSRKRHSVRNRTRRAVQSLEPGTRRTCHKAGSCWRRLRRSSPSGIAARSRTERPGRGSPRRRRRKAPRGARSADSRTT